MNKKKFIEIIKDYISISQKEDNLNKALREWDNDFNFLSFGIYSTLVLKVLKEAMDDKDDWIGYWIYELDMGKDAKENTVTDKDGKNIPIKTISDLYNIIKNKDI